MKIRNLNELLPKLKKFLPQYLELQGIKVDGNKVQCPNHALHNNDDGNLSAGFVPKSDNTVVWCFVENRKFDIIDCYHILEKKPITGKHFYTCVKELCERFSMGYEIVQQESLQDVERNRQRELLEAVHTLSLTNIKKGLPYYKQRKLSKEKIQFFKIGYIEPSMITEQLDKEFKKFYDYKLTNIFTNPSLLIPVYDDYKQYAGLQFRQFDLKGKGSKYLHIKIDKRPTFNISNVPDSDYIYVVEGAFDAIAMYPETSVIAINGNIIQDKEVEWLSKRNYKSIYLALDPDRFFQGETSDGFLKTIMKLKNLDVNLKLVITPEKYDPDSFVCEKGLQAFADLPKKPAIKYLIENYQQGLIKLDSIYEYISGNPSIVRKEKYITLLAKELNIGKRQILGAIDKLETKKPVYNILTYVKEKDSINELLSEFTEMAWQKGFQGVPSSFPMFDNLLGGFEDTIYMLVGYPETGKSLTLINLAYRLMLNNDNYVAFYSLDDGAKRAILPRLLSIVTKMPSKDIQSPTEAIKKKWIKGISFLKSIQSNYTIKDGSEIYSLGDLDRFIKVHYNIAEEGGKKLIIIIDNIHALTASSKYEANENSQRIAQYLKRVPQIFHCPVITTAEVPKSSGKRPTGKDIKESIDYWYAARFVGGIYNSFHSDGQDSHLVWQHRTETEEHVFPVIEIVVSKNQTYGCWHGSLYYKFNPFTNHLIECNAEEKELLDHRQMIY
jgi:DNA primase